ncbi:MAG: metallophosphoesterase [Ideonella sp.]|nr:metallophosphoesterase [Ideonella sp.]
MIFLLSAVLHGYVALRLLPPWWSTSAWPAPEWLAWGPLLGGTLWAWLAASTVLVPLGLLARRQAAAQRWSRQAAERLATLGLVCLGAFSTLFVLTVGRDLLLGASALLGTVLPAGRLQDGAVFASSAAVVATTLVVTAIGAINARRTARVVSVDVPIAGLPPALAGYTIAQISDIHVGPTIKAPYLEAIVDRVNALEADAVAVTGDLVDGTVRDLGPHVAPLARLRARDGVYFVTGNHEYYSGADAWIRELRRLGLRVLLNEHVPLHRDRATLVLAGVTDVSAHHFDSSHRSDPVAALAGAPPGAAVRVLLAHQPRSMVAAARAGFDLQLSGHTHGGQFWPWNLFVPLQQPFTAGLHRFEGLWVYVSRGTGYWGPPKRFGAPSEITRVRLVPA